MRAPTHVWRPSPAVAAAYLEFACANGGTGRLLDIGCADGRRAAHFPGRRYFGIDPLSLRATYPFPFVRALGEHLPFRDASFDAALSVEVLDHSLDPQLCLYEAGRVVAPGGAAFVFVGAATGARDGDTQADTGAYRADYVTTEADVHTHEIGAECLRAGLSPWFTTLEIFHDRGFLACWARERRETFHDPTR